MYYIWDKIVLEDPYYFDCRLQDFEDDLKLDYREKPSVIPEIITYNSKYNDVRPGDYPITGTIFNFLVSNKVVDLLKPFNIEMDVFPSRILRNNGDIFDNYSTINIYKTIECADMDKSIVKIRTLSSGTTIYRFKKIVLDYNKIPPNEKLFWFGEESTFLIVHQDIVDLLERADVTGINLIPVEQYKC